jgi:hypothetical protein
MADAVEVAILSALLNQAVAALGSANIALPNVAFTPPTPSQTASWYRATLLPADTVALGVDPDADNQHYGLLRIDVFYGQNGGELAPMRLAAAVISAFKRGTKLTKDGFEVLIWKTPFRGNAIKDDPWIMIPVSIPYIAFANPA